MKKLSILFVAAIFILPSLECKKEGEVKGKTLQVQNFFGEVKIKSKFGETAPQVGDVLEEGYTVVTGASSIMDLLYEDSVLIRVNENSSVMIAKLMADLGEDSELELKSGTIYATVSKLKKDSEFRVKTKTTVASVRGTSFRVEATEDSARTDVLSGQVAVSPVKDGQVLKEHEQVVQEEYNVMLNEMVVQKIYEKKMGVKAEKTDEQDLENFRKDLASIDPAVVDKLKMDMRKEIRMKILKMKEEQFMKFEERREERLKKFKERFEKKMIKWDERAVKMDEKLEKLKDKEGKILEKTEEFKDKIKKYESPEMKDKIEDKVKDKQAELLKKAQDRFKDKIKNKR